MFKQIDESPLLIRALARLSNYLSRHKGLPMILGVIMIILATIVELVNVSVGSDLLAVIQILLRNVGILITLIGFLLVEPLGK
ncbi:MAG: hypothetical protein KC496_12120 [Anaerolineae bacterium]|nr:hypothetical protein [Anaerolineae bacterium]